MSVAPLPDGWSVVEDSAAPSLPEGWALAGETPPGLPAGWSEAQPFDRAALDAQAPAAPEPDGLLTRFDRFMRTPVQSASQFTAEAPAPAMPQPAAEGGMLSPEKIAAFRQQIKVTLPRMPDASGFVLPDLPMSSQDFGPTPTPAPSVIAGTYNTLAPVVEGMLTPEGIALMGATSGLGALALAGSIPAKAALAGVGATFAGVTAVDTVETVKHARAVLANPASTEQQRFEARAAPVVSGAMSLAALLGVGRLAAGEAIPRINAAYPEVFWRKSGLTAEQFAKDYPATVRRVAGVDGATPSPADIALVQRVNDAAKAAGVKVGDLARGRVVAEQIEWAPRAVQRLIPESLRPGAPAGNGLQFRAVDGTPPPAPAPAAPPAQAPTPGPAGERALLPPAAVDPAQAPKSAIVSAPESPAPTAAAPFAPAQVAPPESLPTPAVNAPAAGTPLALPAPAGSPGLPLLLRGDRFNDTAGNLFEVWRNRSGTIEAHPVIDGKPVVNNQSGVRFALTAEAAARHPEDRVDIAPPVQAAAETPAAPVTVPPPAPPSAPGFPAAVVSTGSTSRPAPPTVPAEAPKVKPASRRQIAAQRAEIRRLVKLADQAAQSSPERAGKFTAQAQKAREKLVEMEATAVTGPTPQVGLDAQGNPDLITHIADVVGHINMTLPDGPQGGEYNGLTEAFSRGAARLLRSSKGGSNIVNAIGELNDAGLGYKFESPSEFYAAVDKAVARRQATRRDMDRQAYRDKVEAMAQTDTKKGRARELVPKTPNVIDEVGVGGEFKLNREKFSVIDTEEGPGGMILYVIQDGHRFTIPEGTPIYPDKGSLKPADVPPPKPANNGPQSDDPFGDNYVEPVDPTPPAPAAGGDLLNVADQFNLAGEVVVYEPSAIEAQRQKEEAARIKAEQDAKQGKLFGSPGFASPPPAAAPGGPAIGQPPPAQSHVFTELPIELPEAVQFFKLMSGGRYPKVRETLRALNGRAAGVFRHIEGKLDSGEIELRADQFNLLSKAEKEALFAQAVDYAKAMTGVDKGADFKRVLRAKFEALVKAAEEESIQAGPRRALAVFWHEIGHFLDFYPTGTTQRGNILGRMASLNHYFKSYLGKGPGVILDIPTKAEHDALYRQAQKELRDEVGGIVETIRREEPVYREIPLTADDITNILKNAAREDFPAFYDWFAKLDRKTKAEILRAAMKGVVDERAAVYGRKIPTGETRVVEEQVTRAAGPEPTKEQTLARFKELLYAELERRDLINVKQIRDELSGAIAWWHNTATIPDYFKPAVEMWADTMSIFFNNPRALAEKAPRFYESFMRWMAVKPGLREEYDKFQRDIASGQIYKDRVVNLRDMFKRDAEHAVLLDEAGAKTTLLDYLDTARILFDRQFGPIERRIGSNPSTAGAAALQAIGNFRYRTTAWEAYALELRNQVEVPLAAAGLSHDDLSEYMFHKRITEGGYRDRAAPLGWNPKNSRERLAEMERQLGPDRWQSLVSAQAAQRTVYQKHVIDLLHRANVLSPELSKAIDEEFFYAPFNQARVFTGANTDAIEQLIKLHHGGEAAGQIYGAVGSLGEIRSPYVQMQHRAFGLISMAHRQIATKSVIRFLQDSDPLAVAEADMRFTGQRLEPVRIDNSQVSTLYTLEAGKVRAYYVKRVIGEMFANGSPLEMRMIALSHTLLGLPKAVLTELNPGFWPVAFLKDVWNASVQLPRGARMVAGIPRAFLAARRTFAGAGDKLTSADLLAQQALDRHVVTSSADSRGEHLGHADEMTRILLRMGKNPVLWNAEVGKIERVLRAFWAGWARQGQILERTVKIASMMHIDRQLPHLPEGRKQQMIRELGGSPDFQAKGRWARVVELGMGMMFYNAWKESVRSQYRAAKGDPRGYWSRFGATVGTGAVLLWAFENALVGSGSEEEEDLRDKLRSIPERDKLRGFVVPLYWSDKAAGKVAYLMLPFPDNLRWAHALFRKSLQTGAGTPGATEGLGGMINYAGQDLPGQNPLITTARELWAYHVEGRNPYDSFTGRPALDETAVKAGEAGGELLKRSLSNVQGGLVYRHRPDRAGDNPTSMEEFLRLPVVSNVLGRWVRVSARGLDELYANAKAPVEKEEARMKLIGEEMIARTLRGEAWSTAQNSLLSESPYLVQYIATAFPRIVMQTDSPFLRQLTQAKTTAEKLAIVHAENERLRARQRRLDRPGVMTPAAP